MRKKPWVIFIISPFLFFTRSVGQTFYEMKYFDVSNGLAHPEVDNVFISKDQKLWVSYSSHEYISNYDGIQWNHFRLSDYGIHLKVIILGENQQGIWLRQDIAVSKEKVEVAYSCLDKNNKITTYSYNGKATLHIIHKEKGLRLLDRQGLIYEIDEQTKQFKNISNVPYFHFSPGYTLHNFHYAPNKNPLFVSIKNKQYQFHYVHNDLEYKSKEITDFVHPLHWGVDTTTGAFNYTYLSKEVDGHHYINQNGERKFSLAENKKFPYSNLDVLMSRPTTNAFIFANNPQNGGNALFQIAKDGHPILISDQIPKGSGRALATDALGNIWFLHSNGLIQLNPKTLFISETQNEMITALHTIGEDNFGGIWFGGYQGKYGFSRYKDGQLAYMTTFPQVSVLPGNYKDKLGYNYFWAEGPVNMWALTPGGKKMTPVNFESSRAGFLMKPLHSGQVALGMGIIGLGIGQLYKGKVNMSIEIGQEKGLQLVNVIGIAEDKGDRIWCSRPSQGLAIYDPKLDTAITWLIEPSNNKSLGAMALHSDQQDNLWIGSTRGLFCLPKASQFHYLQQAIFDKMVPWPLPKGDASKVYALLETDTFLIVTTDKAVHFIEKPIKAPEQTRVYSLWYGIDISGGGSEQNAILKDRDGFIWIGTQQGALKLNPSLFRSDTTFQALGITQWMAGDSVFSFPAQQHDLGVMPLNERRIRFSIKQLGHNLTLSPPSFNLFILNKGGDTLVTRMHLTTIEGDINYLHHGQYQLIIDTYKQNLKVGSTTYQFKIPKTWMESPITWTGLALFMSAIPFLMFWSKQRLKRQKLQFELVLAKANREQEKLKIGAMTGFFNPHFINNTLTTVQASIQMDQQSSQMIGSLAENIELLFQHTRQDGIAHSIEKELSIIKNYLTIQQIRYQDLCIDMQMPKINSLINDFTVPPLMLQIYVENAIEKGIQRRTAAHQLTISGYLEETFFIFEVADDGQGRIDSNSITKNYIKSSTQVMQSLIKLLNQYNDLPITIEYKDFIFSDAAGHPYGTQVTIKIPKNYNYAIPEI